MGQPEMAIVTENELGKMIDETNREFDGGERSQAKAMHDPRQAEPLDLSRWTLDRFRGEPEETKYLVADFVPLGIVGTIYSMGGAGKSTLTLDLSVRVAITDVIPSKWLDKFDVLSGGKVLYFSAEEPETILHKRVRSICEAIAEETGTGFERLWELCKRNLYVVNLWGTAKQLFEVKTISLEPSSDYWSIYNTIRGGDFKLCVFDTRSRLSGAEGAGNALVSREISFFEKIASDFKCTVLILHHINKASYAGGTNAAFAVRGESAFLDSLRLGVHLQTIPEECAAQNGVAEADRFKYLMVTQSKSNYTAIQEPLILLREGWHYSLTELKAGTTRGEQNARQEEQDTETIIETVRQNPRTNQRGLIELLKGRIPMHRVREAIKNALAIEKIIEVDGERGSKLYEAAETPKI
jgi:RecA-family ATPase